jgi:NAD(P)-dependent dehydrogenase (short-subunit alcohol dehydrogenase family)
MMGDVTKLFDLTGKVALVTGGGQGLGQGIAEGFAQFGAAVSVVDINPETSQQVAEGINAAGGHAIAVQCGVSKLDQAQNAVAKTLKEYGKIDVLAAVAGIGDRNMAEDMTFEQWERVININLTGIWLFDQEVGKHMIERGEGGSIVQGTPTTVPAREVSLHLPVTWLSNGRPSISVSMRSAQFSSGPR